MNEEKFENDFTEENVPEMEVVEGENLQELPDLRGQIEALDSQIAVLESRYDESDKPRIEALKRQKMQLEGELNSQQ